MSEFSENDALRGELVEPLQVGTVRSAKHGRTESTPISTSVLAAGTPKYGNFDSHEPIGGQIDVDPKLLKAFDAISLNYVNTDTKAETIDRLPTMGSYTTSVELEDQVLRAYRVVANTFDPEVPEHIFDLLDEIMLKIKEVQPESGCLAAADVIASLLRGAKASARIQLRDSVSKPDIQRASVVLPFCLVGGDLTKIVENPITYTVGGDFDAEVVETGKSNSESDEEQRENIENVKGLISEVESEFEEGAPVGEVLNRSHEIGMDVSKTKQEIEKLRRRGELYEPKQDHLRTT
jgi:replicative DNA helicase Mcm